ncbi:hypothetical protein [Rhodococcus sp. P1Y]|uniref:hypothetical protein n=1 Tax=Rhodococcus sp. P1Y TaxID=1302308 RepID=UPI000EAEFA98|nr:hypothetical protein [Rhodococcus sp. P1Y]AYJ47512.1 hypothetical protein D8W71_03190 [Rhodococcus sp. P1Y]
MIEVESFDDGPFGNEKRREGLTLSHWRSMPNSPTADERLLSGSARQIMVLRNDPETGWARPVWEWVPIDKLD